MNVKYMKRIVIRKLGKIFRKLEVNACYLNTQSYLFRVNGRKVYIIKSYHFAENMLCDIYCLTLCFDLFNFGHFNFYIVI